MVSRTFRTVISLWQEKGAPNFEEEPLNSEFHQVADMFNKKFEGYKHIILLNTTKSIITFDLTLHVDSYTATVNVARQLNYLSQTLYHQYNWQRLSRVPKRLFTVVETTEITPDLPYLPSIPVVPKIIEFDFDTKEERLKYLHLMKAFIENEIRKLEEK